MPFANAFSGWHLIIVLVVVLLLFGATRLPKLSKSLGESVRIFRKSMRDPDQNKDSTADKTGDENSALNPNPSSTAENDSGR